MAGSARPTSRPRRVGALPRLAFAAPVLASLVAGVAGGLLRAGVDVGTAPDGWLGRAVAAHAFLMVCTFMGTVIGLERAVAVGRPAAFAAPLASALAGLAALAGADAASRWLVAGASLAFVAVHLVVVRRQRAAHTVLLTVGAAAWAVGSLLHALGAPAAAVVPWWFAFLVLTVVAERLEMTRLMRRGPGATRALLGACAALCAGAAASAASDAWGGATYGLALAAIALWLGVHDIARRTVRAPGLSRYMAVCLLSGYAWLLVAGLAWTATALGLPWRDAALHGLALGFVFGMVLGHAPVVLPAVARVKLRFGRAFYLPLALLQASLLVRLAPGLPDARGLAVGAAGNALAIAGLAATLAGSALAWRLAHPSPPPRTPDGVAPPS